MIRHLEIMDENNEDHVTILNEIDPTVDCVIIYKATTGDKQFHEVEFNIDQFDIRSVEELKPNNSIHFTKGVIEFQSYSRIRMMLPLGLYPDFKPELKGSRIENIEIDKIQGSNDDILYSIYNKFHIKFKMYDQKLFALNSFVGMHVPKGTTIASFRLIPHFIETWPTVRDVYIICSSYLYERFPNF